MTYQTHDWTVDGDGVAAFLDKRDPQFTGRDSELPRIFG